MLRKHSLLKIVSDKRSQSGAALIVSLLLLLVMTLLGVAALNSSVLQSFMSESHQQQTSSLAFAENTLLAGELDVEALVLDGILDNPARPNWYRDLQADPSLEFAPANTSTTWPHFFVIEYMGQFLIPGESAAVGGGLEDSLIHIFRVSARELAPQRGGERIVQSLYVTLDAPSD